MELIRYFQSARQGRGGCVATIGNFDGVHLGHQAVVSQVTGYARQMGMPSAVLTFEPQPLEYFSPDSAPARLTTLREKYAQFARLGVDRLVCLRFGASLARLSPQEFVESVLLRGLGVRRLVVGDDFRFGAGRRGTFQVLSELAPQLGFEVMRTESCTVSGQRVSSSRVREALQSGRMDLAAELLGRPYRINGRVRRGDGRGRELGFPTANIDLQGRRAPLHGIFAVRVHGLDGRPFEGVASVGTRPVFDGRTLLLEAHVFDFNGTLYGRRIEVEFLRWLRAEEKFDSVETLRWHIAQDVARAHEYFASGTAAGGG